ncbi:MAG: A/G-specific adenine glycosylase [Alphaproteobacteria bacterium]|nr:A/G-specific adenine glycosylase [Alphaproteobacteria bacterium]
MTDVVAKSLLRWYDRHHRELPWRTSPRERAAGRRADPYHVWLSEIMLQQTTVQAVKPYFQSFLRQWPSVVALADAPADDIMKAWAGLGYYSRARNLKKCADIIASEHGGRFPETEPALKALPGIGDYTAAAIAAIAFDRHAAVVDGNIERVISRLEKIEEPVRAVKPRIRALMADLTPANRPGDFAQSMMDLGATICTPKRPACSLCPVNAQCKAFRDGDPDLYPVKPPKRKKPMRRGAAYVAVAPDGAVLLRRRAEKGLLGGMSEVPNSDWTARQDGGLGPQHAPFEAEWVSAGTIVHVFTHFELRLDVYRADVAPDDTVTDGWWTQQRDLAGEALPTVMKKAISAAVDSAFKQR